MSINLILNTASSGMTAAQQQLRVVSDNVSNVNTTGYVRKIAEQRSLVSQGQGSGVEVARIRLATDRFLQAATHGASSEASRQTARYELYDRIQSLFGDPGGDAGFFAQVDDVFSAFAASAEDPASGPRRQEALFKVQALFDESRRISGQIQAVRQDADGRIQTAVDKANGLLAQIEDLNVQIARATVTGHDASGPETAQAELLQQLSALMDVKVSTRSVGGVSIRTPTGALLAGEGHATLEYARAGTVNAETAFNEVWITEPRGQKRPLLDSITSGEIKGLVELRDREAPATAERLAELMTRMADELNRAHNASTAFPAPQTLRGRNTGQTEASAFAGFTGQTTIALVNASGVVQQRADIVFSGGSMTVNGVAATPGTFRSVLSAQLGGATVDFTDGALSISAPAGQGVSIADDPTTPSSKNGRGFSHWFGLNDLVSTNRPSLYDTGLTAASAHGFVAGQTLSLRFTGENGARLRDIQITVPAGAGTVSELVAALNDSATGAGRYGTFSLNASGELGFTGFGDPAPRLSVMEDRTTQTPSGVSVTELFGLGGGVRASRADGFQLRTDIRQASARLALGQLNLSAAAGSPALSSGDGRGALTLADAGQRTTRFSAAGDAGAGDQSVSRYAAELSGDIGGRASLAESRKTSAESLYTEAAARQKAEEGVNLDEELVLMTTYQQAFNASARLIQAAKELYDVLLGIV